MYAVDQTGQCDNCGGTVQADGGCACILSEARKEIEFLREGVVGIMALTDDLHRVIVRTLTTRRE